MARRGAWGKVGALYNRITGDCQRVLALALFHVTALTQQKASCLLFGVSPSNLNTYLRLGMRTLNAILQTLPEAAVVWLSIERQHEFTDLIQGK